jgi:tRNA-modifying protein YgfZ
MQARKTGRRWGMGAADDNDAPPVAIAHAVTAHLFPPSHTRLTDLGVIRAQGAEAAKFLQGQLTQDVEHLAADKACLAGYCSAKGRLLATFVVWRVGPEELLLACSADLLPAVLKRLSMYVLRAKCKLTDASADVPLWGLAGVADAADAQPGPVWDARPMATGHLLRLPDAVVGGVRTVRQIHTSTEPVISNVIELSSWHWLEVMSGTARVVAATAEQFVPQMVNLEVVGGVNFQKGCYPGQEIVARSQYRGTLKRRGFVLTSAVALQPGQEIFHSDDPGQPAGMVVLAGSRTVVGAAAEHAALVELKIAATSGGSLHASAADGPLLSLAPLPYELPTEAA